MASAYYFTQGGKVFKTSKMEAKRILKTVIRKEPVTPEPTDEIGPFVDLDGVSVEQATDLFLQIEVGAVRKT
jgi:hypothetical protein